MSNDKKVVFYDGECALCSGVVRWSYRRDKEGAIWYAPLAGDFAAQHRMELSLPEGTAEAQTFVFWDGPSGQTHRKSRGAAHLLKNLAAPWPVLGSCLLLVPRVLADFGYGIVAANRRSWFGKTEACLLASEELGSRILS